MGIIAISEEELLILRTVQRNQSSLMTIEMKWNGGLRIDQNLLKKTNLRNWLISMLLISPLLFLVEPPKAPEPLVAQTEKRDR